MRYRNNYWKQFRICTSTNIPISANIGSHLRSFHPTLTWQTQGFLDAFIPYSVRIFDLAKIEISRRQMLSRTQVVGVGVLDVYFKNKFISHDISCTLKFVGVIYFRHRLSRVVNRSFRDGSFISFWVFFFFKGNLEMSRIISGG